MPHAGRLLDHRGRPSRPRVLIVWSPRSRTVYLAIAVVAAWVACFTRSRPERAHPAPPVRSSAGDSPGPSPGARPGTVRTPPGAPPREASPAVALVEELPSPVALPPVDDSLGVVPTN